MHGGSAPQLRSRDALASMAASLPLPPLPVMVLQGADYGRFLRKQRALAEEVFRTTRKQDMDSMD